MFILQVLPCCWNFTKRCITCCTVTSGVVPNCCSQTAVSSVPHFEVLLGFAAWFSPGTRAPSSSEGRLPFFRAPVPASAHSQPSFTPTLYFFSPLVSYFKLMRTNLYERFVSVFTKQILLLLSFILLLALCSPLPRF